MGRYDGMKGLVLGVANDHSIAWSIAKELLAEGAEIGFSHLPDRPDDQRQRNRRRVALLTDDEPNAKFLVPMDVSSDEQIAAVMETAKAEENAYEKTQRQNHFEKPGEFEQHNGQQHISRQGSHRRLGEVTDKPTREDHEKKDKTHRQCVGQNISC